MAFYWIFISNVIYVHILKPTRFKSAKSVAQFTEQNVICNSVTVNIQLDLFESIAFFRCFAGWQYGWWMYCAIQS